MTALDNGTMLNSGGIDMTQYSIEQVQTQLDGMIQAVEQGEVAEIMRQVEQVAVLLSVGEYNHLKKEKPGFGKALEEFRQKYNVEDADIDPDEIFRDLRDRSPGREVIL
ncbi:MAG: prevent-host-death family protein [Cyanobacteria bacterium CAN_BIN43]|nr:prevent-host-death family protein [Cyanobacteria bacterium CAN_BIN43]